MNHYGAVEAGGTKFVLAVCDETYQILAREEIPTTNPKETLGKVIDFFQKNPVVAIGVGAFGPIDLNSQSSTFGWIKNTPKLAWQNTDLAGILKEALQVPIRLTTDVNASCYGEYLFGRAKGKQSCVYFTVGTGIGAGAINQGQFVRGFSHPEMGHMKIDILKEDSFAGNCPFHHNCLEGMASGPALEKRTGLPGKEIKADDLTWDYTADYLAQAAYNTSLMFDTEVIIFGGGVMKQVHLLPAIQEKFIAYNNQYLTIPVIEDYLCLPSLGDDQGILGCFALAQQEA